MGNSLAWGRNEWEEYGECNKDESRIWDGAGKIYRGFVYIATRGIGGVGGSGSRPWQLFPWRAYPRPASSSQPAGQHSRRRRERTKSKASRRQPASAKQTTKLSSGEVEGGEGRGMMMLCHDDAWHGMVGGRGRESTMDPEL